MVLRVGAGRRFYKTFRVAPDLSAEVPTRRDEGGRQESLLLFQSGMFHPSSQAPLLHRSISRYLTETTCHQNLLQLIRGNSDKQGTNLCNAPNQIPNEPPICFPSILPETHC